MRRSFYLPAAVLLALLSVASCAAQSLGELQSGFRSPPQKTRLRCYWWWLNGHTDKPTITHDLEEMKRMGFAGAILVDADGSGQAGNAEVPAGPMFGTPEWTALYVHALKEAERVGLEISLNITSGWNLGGPRVKPEDASKILTWTRVTMKGGASIHVPQPASKNGFYRDIAVLAYPLHHDEGLSALVSDGMGDRHTAREHAPSRDPLRFRSASAEAGFSMPDTSAMLNAGPDANSAASADASVDEVRDVSASLHGDVLQWAAPAGEWEILRVGFTDSGAVVSTASGKWQGLAIDYMDHRAFDTYWADTVEPLLQAGKPYVGKSLKYLVTDSWELGGTNWTWNFREAFSARRGYDPVKWLPVIAGRILQNRDASTRFLTDLRRTVGDLITTEHYDHFAARAAEWNLGIHPESGGPHGAPIDALATFRRTAFPQTEYWAPNAHRATDTDRFFTKEAASAANIYGKHFVAAEGMTSIGPQWSESLAADLKPAFDRSLTEGMNLLIWHEFTSSPADTGFPGQEYFAGTHLNPKVTWWHAGGDFFAYLNRSQYMLQQGNAVNDVLYFAGDNVPSFVRLKADDPARVLPGYDYDVTNEDALLHQLSVVDGVLRGPEGMSWKLLVLPKTGRLSLTALRKVEELLLGGATVAGAPPLSPTGAVSSAESSEFAATVHRLWDGCPAMAFCVRGKGKLIATQDGRAALQVAEVAPDAQLTPVFDYVHRQTKNADIYFVRNTTAHDAEGPVSLRSGRKFVALWNAVTGSFHPIQVSRSGASSALQLRLPPYGSTFVVFSDVAPTDVAEQPKRGRALVVSPWSLRFEKDRGAPTEASPISKFESWSGSPQAGIRYFSGTAYYSASITLTAEQAARGVELQLSELHEVAQVRVNGEAAGTIWAQPLSLEIRKGLHEGKNEIEIAVTNLWPNRIIGDLQSSSEKRFTSTNIRGWKANSPLLKSGILGEVRVFESVPR